MSTRSSPIGCLWAIALVFLTAIVLAAAYILMIYIARYGKCVRLENGLIIGYEAIIDLSRPINDPRRPLFMPILVPKFDDGTPLIREDLWPIFVTDTVLYGTTAAAPLSDTQDFDLAWRADTGLVLRSENRKLFEEIINSPGTRNYGIPVYGISTGALFNDLIKRPEFAKQRCKTALLTW